MPKSTRKTEEKIRRAAAAMLERGTSVEEFSESFFGPSGMLRDLWTTESERKKVVGSPLYRELKSQLGTIRQREAKAFDDDVERLSGRLTVVVPKSLHGALRMEAAREGISLSELIRLKLAVPYRVSVRLMAQGSREPEAA